MKEKRYKSQKLKGKMVVKENIKNREKGLH